MRQIHTHPFPIFPDIPDHLISTPQGSHHIPGQAAAIRFFDHNSKTDFKSLQQILASKPVRFWMDDCRISWHDYQEWAGKHTPRSFLFAVHDARLEHSSVNEEVKGFVNIYSERKEKFRIKRMVKAKIIKKPKKHQHILEISMALKPAPTGESTGSGLMSSALRQSCLQVRSLLNFPRYSDLIIYAFVDPTNVASIRAIEASGFIKRKKMKYDTDSSDQSTIYLLSWIKLHRKIKNTMLKLLEDQSQTLNRIILEPQQTDSHCGPAVVQGLLGFHGIKVSQDQIVTAANIQTKIIKFGMRPSQIAKAVTILAPNLQLWFKQQATAKDLHLLIHQYHFPVAINWQSLFYNSLREEKKLSPNDDHGHYSIVLDIKTDRNQIVIDDPYSTFFGVPRYFSFRWFKTRWWDSVKTIRTQKLLFIITPKSFSPPPSLHLQPASKLPL